MAIPQLDVMVIMGRANDKSWARGDEIYKDGDVYEVVWRDGMVTAEVQGSEEDPYIVQIKIEKAEVVSAFCSCPYDWGGDCKHIVAMFLYMLNRRDDVEERDSVEKLLEGLDDTGLRALIADIVDTHPRVVDTIDEHVTGESRERNWIDG